MEPIHLGPLLLRQVTDHAEERDPQLARDRLKNPLGLCLNPRRDDRVTLIFHVVSLPSFVQLARFSRLACASERKSAQSPADR